MKTKLNYIASLFLCLPLFNCKATSGSKDLSGTMDIGAQDHSSRIDFQCNGSFSTRGYVVSDQSGNIIEGLATFVVAGRSIRVDFTQCHWGNGVGDPAVFSYSYDNSTIISVEHCPNMSFIFLRLPGSDESVVSVTGAPHDNTPSSCSVSN